MNYNNYIESAEKTLINNKSFILRIFFSTLLLGFIVHGGLFSQYIYNNDSVAALSSSVSSGQIQWKIILGRFMQPVYYLFRGHLAEPWLIGILTLVWISIANILIIKTFQIRNTFLQVAVCALMLTNQAITYTNSSCIHESDSYALALMFSLLTVYTCTRFKKGYILAPLFLFISLGLYQAYLAVTISCFAILIIRKFLEVKELREIWAFSKKVIFILGIAGLCYCVFLQSYFYVLDIDTRKGTNDVNNVYTASLSSLTHSLYYTYKTFFQYLYQQRTYHSYLVCAINAGLALWLCIKFFSYIFITEKNLIAKLSFTVIVLLLPLFFNLTYFLAKGLHHELMGFSLSMVYMLCVASLLSVHAEVKQKYTHYVLSLVFCIISFSNSVFANHTYLLKRLNGASDQVAVTRIISDIERLPDYVPASTPVLLIGSLSYTDRKRDGFSHLEGYSQGATTGLTSNLALVTYVKEHLNKPIVLSTRTIKNDEKLNQAAKKMPSFPHKGYCRMVDGTLLVKLTD